MKKSGLFIANIVLGSVLAIFAIVSTVIIVFMKNITEGVYDSMDWAGLYEDASEEEAYSDYEREVYEYPIIRSASARAVGDAYNGETAYEGYQYYAVTVTVYNGGTQYLIPEYLELYCDGLEYDDVYNEYFYDEEAAEEEFYYANMDVIPAGQTGNVEVILQVREGVKELQLILDRTYETGDVQNVELTLP